MRQSISDTGRRVQATLACAYGEAPPETCRHTTVIDKVNKQRLS